MICDDFLCAAPEYGSAYCPFACYEDFAENIEFCDPNCPLKTCANCSEYYGCERVECRQFDHQTCGFI